MDESGGRLTEAEPATKKRSRRLKGTGGIITRTLKDGTKVYIGRASAGYTRAGDVRRVEVRGRTEAEAKRKLKKKIAELEADATTTGSAMTVKAWSDEWLRQQTLKLRPKTVSTYRSAMRWIVQAIGHRKLAELTPRDIRSVTSLVLSPDPDQGFPNGRTTSTALHAHRVLTSMLRDAIGDGHPVPPRVLMVDAPSAGENDRDAIPYEDAPKILAAAAKLPDGSRWVAALLQGLRQGEALGLCWDAIDLENGTIDVSWQLQALPYAHGCAAKPCGMKRAGSCTHRRLRVPRGYAIRQLDGALCLVRPKTATSQRIVPMVPWMTAALRSWREIAPKSPHGLVWPRPDGRPALAGDDRDAWHRLQDAAGVRHATGRPYGVHEARHTTATILLEAGVDTEVIRAVLGHSSIVTTKNYQHVSQTLARQAMEAVAKRLELI